jgi:atypical dual specificity phosphatase
MGMGGVFLRRLRAMVLDMPTGFVWVEEGKVAASGYPASRRQVEWLVGRGVNAILTLTPDPLPRGWVDDLPLLVEHVPMVDHEVPDLVAMKRGAALVQDWVGGGRTVLVHCLAGEGRTGCVLAAYMVKTRGMGAEEAMAEIRKVKRAFVEQRQEGAIFELASEASSTQKAQ